MKIDAHQHFWKYSAEAYGWITDEMLPLKQDCLPADLKPLLKQAGFDGCVAVQARQSLEETDFLLELAAEAPFIRAVVGWADLQDEQLEATLERYQDAPLLKGIRHIVQDEPDDQFLLRPAFLEGIATLGRLGYTYDILIYERHLPVVADFLQQSPEQPFVLDHLGKPEIAGDPSEPWRRGIRTIAQRPYVYCKLSGMVTEADWNNWEAEDFRPYLDTVLEAFGPERLMIGSDWPVCLLAANSYGSVVQIVAEYISALSESEQAAIYGGTAAQFYQIN
jgi:L-fuconolactonase